MDTLADEFRRSLEDVCVNTQGLPNGEGSSSTSVNTVTEQGGNSIVVTSGATYFRPAELDADVKVMRGAIKLADLNALYTQIQQEKDRLDGLFVNEGGGTMVPFEAATEQHLNDAFDVNVKGVVFTVQKALSHISDWGAVVPNASPVRQGSGTYHCGTAGCTGTTK